MTKRDRLLALVAGSSQPGYVPAAFFLHFPPAFHQGRAAIEKHAEFFGSTDMDLVKIQFERKYPEIPMATPSDWARLPSWDEAFYRPQVEVVRGLVELLGPEAIVVCTLYSPFMIAGQISGVEALQKHLLEDPEAVARGLEIIRDSLMVFVREAVGAGLDGFYHSTQGGESGRFKGSSVFDQWIKPIDLAVMGEIAKSCPFNILHVCDYHRDQVGGYADLTPFEEYPGHVVNCSLEVGGKVLAAATVAERFGRPFMGGMDRLGVLATGSESEVSQAARDALGGLPPGSILAADCTVPSETPWSNLRAAIDEAHHWAGG